MFVSVFPALVFLKVDGEDCWGEGVGKVMVHSDERGPSETLGERGTGRGSRHRGTP